MFSWSVRRVFALVSASLLLLSHHRRRRVGTGRAADVWVAPTRGGSPRTPVRWRGPRRATTVATGLLDRWMRMRQASDWRPDHRHPAAPSFRRGRQPHVLDRRSVPGGREPERNRHLQRLSRLELAPYWANWSPRSTRMGSCASRRIAQLATSPAGNLARWRTTEVTVFSVTGSGYDKVTTARNLSPNGKLQTAATSKGTITIQRTSDGSIVRTLSGGTRPAFSPDSSMIAEWTASPNRITVRRISDGAVVRTFDSARRRRRRAAALHAGRRAGGDQRVSALPQARRHLGPEGSDPVLEHVAPGGALVKTYDQQTSLGVTTPVVFSPLAPDGAASSSTAATTARSSPRSHPPEEVSSGRLQAGLCRSLPLCGSADSLRSAP